MPISFVAAGAMGASIMVSYTRAKSDALGYSSGMGLAAVGIMPREIRLVILCGGLVLGGLFGTAPAVGADAAAIPTGILVIDAALAIIAIGATLTVIQRVLHTRAQARSAALNTAATPTEGETRAS